MIKRVSVAVSREIEASLRPLGITNQQSITLQLLINKPGMTHTDLEHLLHIEKSSVTSLINGMVKKGWVYRQQHVEDARIKQVFLTDEGFNMAQTIDNAVGQVKNRFEEVLSQEERVILGVLLRKVLKAYE
ncbi:MarR family winged helix-turn-helix transcriptional regulator [Brevibacillus dissolubilis]|uniref:MarR family winged helix-turn-helix transcriptional regulator n=1 Tax=Brevibacillus dissolubilis TaxID=1844116 RepID=UPI0021001903|nr:MarR family transcriptional regulator [Brevibacillus dissolubilis]